MTKSEKNRIIKWANALTDKELEKEYYNAAFDTLGSQAEEMYERGWDRQDVIEREKYEKWLVQKADLLERLCYEQGFWETDAYVGVEQIDSLVKEMVGNIE